MRTFGVLLLIGSSQALLTWIAQAFWDFWPTWMAVAETTVFAALGLGLIRMGRKLVLPTFALLLIAELVRFIRLVPTFEQAGMVALAVPLVAAVLEILPALLLLIGVPSRARFRAALVLFIVLQVAALVAAAIHVFVTQRTDLQ